MAIYLDLSAHQNVSVEEILGKRDTPAKENIEKYNSHENMQQDISSKEECTAASII